MTATHYFPYKEVDFKFSAETGILSVNCPWLNVEVEVDAENSENTTEVLKQISKGLWNDEKVQEFLAFFSDLPILNYSPRKLEDCYNNQAVYESKGTEILEADGPLQFIKRINPFDDLNADRTFAYFPRQWQWDAQEIAEASQIKGTELYDPVSVYMGLRSKRLNFAMTHDADATNLLTYVNSLKKNDEQRFFAAMTLVLCQQYYTTRNIYACVEPAIHSLPEITEEAKAYSREEINHDRLVYKSMKHISSLPPSDFVYMPEIKMKIEAIKYAAVRCALGFSVLISIMEGSGVYADNDTLAEMLRDSSRPDSHVGISEHFLINKKSNHVGVPEGFVAKLPPVTLDTVKAATRLTEITMLVDVALLGSMHRYMLSESFEEKFYRRESLAA